MKNENDPNIGAKKKSFPKKPLLLEDPKTTLLVIQVQTHPSIGGSKDS